MKSILKIIAIIIAAVIIALTAAASLKDNKEEENLIKVYTSELKNEMGSLEHDLPIVVINTNGQTIEYKGKDEEHADNIVATMEIYNNSNSNTLEKSPILQEKVFINIRGNTTRSLPKKQYSFNFIDDNNKDIERDILGMGEYSKWILNASMEDKSLMRNYIAYNLSANIMSGVPRAKYCEVYFIDDGSNTISKDNYVGIYLIIDRVTLGKDRIDIIESVENQDETSFIVGRNNARYEDILINNYGLETYLYGYNMIVYYPKSKITEGQKDYINSCISEFERALYSAHFDDENTGYAKYIDVDSFVNYYIINEFFKNTDCGTFSTYLYKNIGGKITMGPVWDFDNALGNSTAVGELYDPSGFYLANKMWFAQLMKDDKFADKVIKRYEELRKSYLSEENIMNTINTTYSYINKAQAKNFEVWPIDICNQSEVFKNYYGLIRSSGRDIDKIREFFNENPSYLVDDSNMPKTYDEEISKLKEFLSQRGKWIDDNIEELKKFE